MMGVVVVEPTLHVGLYTRLQLSILYSYVYVEWHNTGGLGLTRKMTIAQ